MTAPDQTLEDARQLLNGDVPPAQIGQALIAVALNRLVADLPKFASGDVAQSIRRVARAVEATEIVEGDA